MTDAYVSTVYSNVALAKAGINTVVTDKLVSVSTYQEGSKWMFLVVRKA